MAASPGTFHVVPNAFQQDFRPARPDRKTAGSASAARLVQSNFDRVPDVPPQHGAAPFAAPWTKTPTQRLPAEGAAEHAARHGACDDDEADGKRDEERAPVRSDTFLYWIMDRHAPETSLWAEDEATAQRGLCEFKHQFKRALFDDEQLLTAYTSLETGTTRAKRNERALCAQDALSALAQTDYDEHMHEIVPVFASRFLKAPLRIIASDGSVHLYDEGGDGEELVLRQTARKRFVLCTRAGDT